MAGKPQPAAEEVDQDERHVPDEMAEKRDPTGMIVVRIGGAPEQGGPDYTISLDGQPVANGKLDWALGMPAVDGSETATVMWRDLNVPWDFSDGLPGEVRIAFENDPDGAFAQSHNLLVDFVEIDGLLLAADGIYANYPDGRRPWLGDGGDSHQSWHGELVFKLGGEPALEPQPAGADTLVVQMTPEDAKNSEILVDLAAVRRFMHGEGDYLDDAERSEALAEIGLEPEVWRDLKVLDPGGRPVDLDAPPPVLDAREMAKRLRQSFYEDIFDEANGLVRYRADMAVPAAPAASETDPMIIVHEDLGEAVSRDAAEQIRTDHFAKVLRQTLEQLQKGPSKKSQAATALGTISRDVAERMVKGYLDGVIAKALGRIAGALAESGV